MKKIGNGSKIKRRKYKALSIVIVVLIFVLCFVADLLIYQKNISIANALKGSIPIKGINGDYDDFIRLQDLDHLMSLVSVDSSDSNITNLENNLSQMQTVDRIYRKNEIFYTPLRYLFRFKDDYSEWKKIVSYHNDQIQYLKYFRIAKTYEQDGDYNEAIKYYKYANQLNFVHDYAKSDEMILNNYIKKNPKSSGEIENYSGLTNNMLLKNQSIESYVITAYANLYFNQNDDVIQISQLGIDKYYSLDDDLKNKNNNNLSVALLYLYKAKAFYNKNTNLNISIVKDNLEKSLGIYPTQDAQAFYNQVKNQTSNIKGTPPEISTPSPISEIEIFTKICGISKKNKIEDVNSDFLNRQISENNAYSTKVSKLRTACGDLFDDYDWCQAEYYSITREHESALDLLTIQKKIKIDEINSIDCNF
jgi:hypothetical protein